MQPSLRWRRQWRLHPRPAAGERGLTLIELTIAAAVLAILATLAVPTLGERLGRQRVATAAEMLALDLAEARVEAVQSGRRLYLVFDRRPDWCYAVARSADCGCASAQPCQLKVVRAADYPGVHLAGAVDTLVEPDGTATPGAGAQWRGASGGHELSVGLSPLGRPKLCSGSAMPGYPAC